MRYQAFIDVNDVGDVLVITPSHGDKKEYLFFCPYGWNNQGVVIDKRNVDKLMRIESIQDALAIKSKDLLSSDFTD
jgi:hypothetical protein